MQNLKFVLCMLLLPILATAQLEPLKHHESLEPYKNKHYLLSAWVSEDNINVLSYVKPSIIVEFKKLDGTISEVSIKPAGAIIEGWQKIEDTILIPEDSYEMNIRLRAGENNVAYFDDLRIIPFDGSIKSFVYDENDDKLLAELDENNYATFYEYDQEGGLIRVKKETERGVFTIQETRSNTKK